VGLGFSELAILLVAVLVLVRPQDAPRLARQLGMLWTRVRMNWRGIWLGWQEQADKELDVKRGKR
jgi:Sec-independent protein translocase protein TatA